jgi:hypothetical protein
MRMIAPMLLVLFAVSLLAGLVFKPEGRSRR